MCGGLAHSLLSHLTYTLYHLWFVLSTPKMIFFLFLSPMYFKTNQFHQHLYCPHFIIKGLPIANLQLHYATCNYICQPLNNIFLLLWIRVNRFITIFKNRFERCTRIWFINLRCALTPILLYPFTWICGGVWVARIFFEPFTFIFHN